MAREWGVVFSHASEQNGGLVDGPHTREDAAALGYRVARASGVEFELVSRRTPNAPWASARRESPADVIRRRWAS